MTKLDGYKVIESAMLIIDKVKITKKTRKWKKKSIIKTTVSKPNPNAFMANGIIYIHPATLRKLMMAIEAKPPSLDLAEWRDPGAVKGQWFEEEWFEEAAAVPDCVYKNISRPEPGFRIALERWGTARHSGHDWCRIVTGA